MIIKSLKLSNFRQFRDEEIEFSTDPYKNVTIIHGDNGTGKTTFLQSFFWCFYGETDFSEKELLNRDVKHNLKEGEEATVRVIIELEHINRNYRIDTSQVYTKKSNDKVTKKRLERNMFYIEDSGNQIKLEKEYEVDAKINEIMPKDISRYFFFDGEDINQLSKEVSSNNKNYSFEKAISGLLGYKPFQIALDTLNPRADKHSVIASYENDFNVQDDKELEEMNLKIHDINLEIKELDEKINIFNNEKEEASKGRAQMIDTINKSSEGKALQSQKESLESDINKNQELIYNKLAQTSNAFSKSSWEYFAAPLIDRALDLVNTHDIAENEIPNIHWNVVESILNDKVCICGRELCDESTNHLKSLKEYLPPQSMGLTINTFKSDSQRYMSNVEDIFELVKGNTKYIDERSIENDHNISNIMSIDEQLGNYESTEKAQKQYEMFKKIENHATNKINELIEHKGILIERKEKAEEKRTELNLKSSENRAIEVYRAYAFRIYELLNNTYKSLESDKRQEFEIELNRYFKELFSGDLKISVDENYRILVYEETSGKREAMETSSGQSIAVIFSFIAAILKLIKRDKGKHSEAELHFTEPMPLVMDAPLSLFDTKRIENFSSLMPDIAEQVIIFLKDTEGNIAKEHMSQKIGAEYSFDKISTVETRIIS